jgi:L-lactate utilization protein LutB
MAGKEGRRADARDCVRCGAEGPVRYDMLGGTDCEASRATGPIGMAVTGTSISEKGVPKR